MGHCNPKGTNMEKQVIFLLLTTSFACGKASTLDDRIIGGTNATIEEFPYQASLQVRNASGEAPLYKHLCGAAVIGRNWLVSAAHCIQSRYASKLVVRAGTTNRYEGGSLHHVVNVIKHPDYDVEIDYDCDISLLKVKEPFVYSTRIQPILLPEADSDVACGTLATVAGWGNSEAPAAVAGGRRGARPAEAGVRAGGERGRVPRRVRRGLRHGQHAVRRLRVGRQGRLPGRLRRPAGGRREADRRGVVGRGLRAARPPRGLRPRRRLPPLDHRQHRRLEPRPSCFNTPRLLLPQRTGT